jgi:hypothetical protein
MTTTVSNITFGSISNVRKSGDEEGVYFANVEASPAEGFPMESCLYCARSDDYAMTGRWVYAQIIAGNIVGAITQLDAGVDPETGLPPVTRVSANQPSTNDTQIL